MSVRKQHMSISVWLAASTALKRRWDHSLKPFSVGWNDVVGF